MRGAPIVVLALAASPGVPAPAGAAAAYSWPLAPRPSVVRAFDPPERHWESGHRGVDLAAAPRSAVLSARSGTVWFAGPVAGRPVVSIRHGDGLITTYEPVTANVERGDHVGRGEVIGVLQPGHPGCPRPACLHWGARRGAGHDADYLNPLGLLGVLRVRLKPLTPADAPDRAPPAGAPR